MRSRVAKSFRKQAGNLLITTGISLGVLSLVQIGTIRYMLNTGRDTTGAITGAQLAKIQGALSTYIDVYGSQIKNNGPITGVANPLAPTVAELTSLNLMDVSGATAPAIGGVYLTQVSTVPSPCGSNCNVRAKVWLRDPLVDPDSGGADIRVLGAAVRAGKGGISFSIPSSPTVIQSAAGWSEPNPDPALRAGILMAATGYDTSALSGYLKRDGTQPVTADFPMTGLDGVARSITGAKNITAAGTIATTGDVSAATVSATGAVTAATVAAGTVTAAAVQVSSGNNLRVGNVIYYGDTANGIVRQPGDFHIQKVTGWYTNAYASDYYIVAAGKWASQSLSIGPAEWFHYGPNGGVCPDGWILQGTSGWWATYTDVWNLCRPIW